MGEGWQWIVELHRNADVQALFVFWGAAAGFVVLVLMLWLVLRSGRLARRAVAELRELRESLAAAVDQLDAVDSRIDRRVEMHAGELDTRMIRKIDQKCDLIQQQMDERKAACDDSLSKLNARVGRFEDNEARFRQRVEDVEARIPGLFDRLDEFRDTLASTFQVELSTILRSFDSSVGAVLQQMKAELQTGVSRIEGIESMVKSRQNVERTLLGTSAGGGLPEPGEGLGEDEMAFEEWEVEAKQLAEAEEQDEEAEEAESASEDPDEGIRAVHVEVSTPAPEDDEAAREQEGMAPLEADLLQDEDEEADGDANE